MDTKLTRGFHKVEILIERRIRHVHFHPFGEQWIKGIRKVHNRACYVKRSVSALRQLRRSLPAVPRPRSVSAPRTGWSDDPERNVSWAGEPPPSRGRYNAAGEVARTRSSAMGICCAT